MSIQVEGLSKPWKCFLLGCLLGKMQSIGIDVLKTDPVGMEILDWYNRDLLLADIAHEKLDSILEDLVAIITKNEPGFTFETFKQEMGEPFPLC